MTVSPHYQLSAGTAYAAWQLRAMEGLGAEAARRFRPYVKADDVCLDFGCGGGRILSYLEVRHRMGVEPNEIPAQTARGRGIEIFQTLGDVRAGSTDIIISNHALEHCLEPFRELSGMRRALKPGGRLVLVLPIDDWRRSRRFHPADKNHHLFAWTPLLIGNLVTDAGFVVSSITVVRHAYPPGAGILWRNLPEFAFDGICSAWSAVALMRQLKVVATRP
jgi:SAM-dependent methyltransferase